MAYKRDSEDLREALKEHSVAGYPIEIKRYGRATIVRQGGMEPIAHRNTYTGAITRPTAKQPFFVVRLDNPVPFSKYAEQERLSKDPLTPDQWNEVFDRKDARIGFGDETLRRLQKGEAVSRWEAQYEAMYDGGMLDGDGNIIYVNSVFPEEVKIPDDKLKYGMLVDVTDRKEKGGLPGRFWGKVGDGQVALLELFSTIPYMETPDSVASDFIKPEFISEYTYALGYGVREAWEMMRGKDKVPKGHFVGDQERIYYLDEAIPLAKIEKLCRDYAKRELAGQKEPPHCVWQAVILNILPVFVAESTFRPLPEDVVTDEMVVSFGEE